MVKNSPEISSETSPERPAGVLQWLLVALMALSSLGYAFGHTDHPLKAQLKAYAKQVSPWR